MPYCKLAVSLRCRDPFAREMGGECVLELVQEGTGSAQECQPVVSLSLARVLHSTTAHFLQAKSKGLSESIT